jgi:hypothetical protein
MDREKHLSRYVTAPDGETYMIAQITDSNTFILEREYAGSSVTLSNGAFTIQADEDYALAQAIDDSGWTIQKSDWNADADDLPLFDNSGNAYYYYFNGAREWRFANLDFKPGTFYSIRMNICRTCIFNGCLFQQTVNGGALYFSSSGSVIERCVHYGSGAGSQQNGLILVSGFHRWKNLIIDNMGDHSISAQSSDIYMDGVNIGVETGNNIEDLHHIYEGRMYGKDVSLGGQGTGGIWETSSGAIWNSFWTASFENYGRVLGAHKTFNPQGELTKVDVVAGSGDPYKRSGGNDSVIEILYTLADLADNIKAPVSELTTEIFCHEFESTTDAKSYRYYVQGEGGVLATEIWLECEYVSSYDDTSEYTYTTVLSDEAITARSDASDWTQYIEVTNIQPAVASKVRVKLFCSYYHATNKIYIDPKVVITDA